MNIPKDKTVAFTGYRPEKIRRSSSNPDIEREIRAALNLIIRELYGRGFRYFLSGMAEGFDLWAADEVLKLGRGGECPGIELVAVVPFEGQNRGYSVESALLYEVVLCDALCVHILAPRYFPECYMRRNDWLVDHSSHIVTYFDGQQGGTRYTVLRAEKAGVPVINIYDPSLIF